MKKKTMLNQKGVSMMSLVITIVLIIIIASVIFASSRSSIGNANKSAFIQELTDIEELVAGTRISNQIYGSDEEYENKGFYKKKIINPPASFVSFDDNAITGYVVDLETVQFKDANRGIEYKAFMSDEKKSVTFEKDDVYVYDAEGTVYYAKGITIENTKFYTTKELSADGPIIIRKKVVPAEDVKSAEVQIVLKPIGDGNVTVTIGGENATLIEEDGREKTFAVDVYENKTYMVVASEEGKGTTTVSVDVSVIDVPTYQIIYNANGGINEPPPETKTENIVLKLSLQSPEREGYTFMGWATTADSTLVEYKPGSQFTTDEDTVLYAVWVEGQETYNVVYSANGGNGAPEAEFGVSETYQISLQVPRRVGFAFDGWSTDPKAISSEYKPGDLISLEKNLELYAVWKSSMYTLSITVEPQFAGSIVGSGAKEADANVVISATPATGYVFKNWKVVTGGAKLASTISSTTSFKMPDADVSIVAYFDEVMMTLKYDANGGEGAPGEVIAAQNSTQQISTRIPVRAGHNFLGWSPRSDATSATIQPGEDYNLVQNVVLYAVWEKQEEYYTLSFDLEEGEEATEGDFATQTKKAGETLQIPFVEPVKDGFTFLGWLLDPTSTDIVYRPGEIYERDANTILYARFVDLQPPTIGLSVKYEGEKLVVMADVYDNGVIAGYNWTTTPGEPESWDIEKAGVKTLALEKEDISVGDNYFWAKDYAGNVGYEKIVIYDVKYDANQGVGAPQRQLKAQGVPLTLSYTEPTREEFKFLGWSASSRPGNDMTSVTYSSGDTYENDSSATLTAVWGIAAFDLSSTHIETRIGAPATDVLISKGLYTGDITVTSSDDLVAKVDLIGDTIRITPVDKAGSATITVKESTMGVTRTITVSMAKGNRVINATTKTLSYTYGDASSVVTLSYEGYLSTTTTVSSNENVATAKVNRYDITVTPKNYGTTKITVIVAEDDGYEESQIELQVSVKKKDLIVTPTSGQKKIYDTTISTPNLTYTYKGNIAGETPKFSGALVREEGRNVGKYAISIGSLGLVDNGRFLADNYNLELDETIIYFEILHSTVEMPPVHTNQEYDGTIKIGVQEGEGYVRTGSYEAVNAGTYTLTLRLTDPNTLWADTRNAEERLVMWKINACTILSAQSKNMWFVQPITDKVYTGSNIEPSVQITGFGSTLVEGKDYTLSYANNLNVGTATVTIKGISNFSETTTVTFKITPATMQVDSYGYSGTYDGAAHSITVNVTKPATGATVYYGTTALTSANYKTSGSTTKPTYTNITNKTVYYYVEAPNFNASSGSKTVVITQKTITSGMTVSGIQNKQYTGANITQAISIVDNALQRTLVNGTDYTVAYSNNKNLGTATVTITGKGNYKDSISRTFTITGETVTIRKSTEALTTSLTVTISKEVAATSIQYSYNNSTWTNYTGPITITADTTIYARTIDKNNNNAVIGTASTKITNICEHSEIAPTCTANGYCGLCGYVMSNALGHTYGTKSVTSTYLKSSATCLNPASYYYKCNRCTASSKGATNTTYTNGSALGHSWAAATCTTPSTCRNCGQTTGSAAGHSWSSTGSSSGTCVSLSYTNYRCSKCGETKTEYGSYGSHSYNAATCTKPKTCIYCSGTSGSAKGHSYSAYSSTSGTCVTQATTSYRCSSCGDSYTTNSGYGGHSYNAATCTSPKTCRYCGGTSGSANGHNYSVTGSSAGNCTTKSYTSYRCSSCGDSYTDYGSYGSTHNYTSSTTAGTCTTASKTTYTCTRCGSSYYTTGSTNSSNHTGSTKSSTTSATCTSNGSTRYYCSACNGTISTTTIPAPGHSWVAATCTSAKYCSTCRTTSGYALGHSWVSPTCTSAGYCSKCYAAGSPAPGHSYTSSTTAGTCTTRSKTTYSCRNCSYSYSTNGSYGSCSYTSSTKAGDCKTKSVTTYTCRNCGGSYSTTGSYGTAHYGPYGTRVVLAATCTSKGKVQDYCAACDAVMATRITDALGHKTSSTVVKVGTCGKYTKTTCSRCSYESNSATTYTHLFRPVAGTDIEKCICGLSRKI